MTESKNCKIKIVEDGPYIVSGGVPLSEQIISSDIHGLVYATGRSFPVGESYALCRCGHSKNMPFCDGSHASSGFDGTETASKEPYLSRAEVVEGPRILLTDAEELCAFARFCHTEHGSVWELAESADDDDSVEAAVKAACNCPAGRLVAWDRETGEAIEPVLSHAIVLLQDPARGCSGPLWVKGGIPIESADGSVYEVRNRVTLCRCGESDNKPFCDANHVSMEFSDKPEKE